MTGRLRPRPTARSGWRMARWKRRDRLFLTLKSPGMVRAHWAEPVAARLRTFQAGVNPGGRFGRRVANCIETVPRRNDAVLQGVDQRQAVRQGRRTHQCLRSRPPVWRWRVRGPAELWRQGVSAREASRPPLEFGQGDPA